MTTIAIGMQEQGQSWPKEIALSFAASILIALAAPFTLPLPFSPVPLAMQCHVALLLAALLGPRRGFLTLLFFLGEGAMGYPVFAGGAAGIAHLLGPRGGYLFGYLLAAFYVGLLQSRNVEKDSFTLGKNMALGNLLVYLCGWGYLSTFLGMERAFLLGVAPFVLGDLLKLLFFTKLGSYYYAGRTR